MTISADATRGGGERYGDGILGILDFRRLGAVLWFCDRHENGFMGMQSRSSIAMAGFTTQRALLGAALDCCLR